MDRNNLCVLAGTLALCVTACKGDDQVLGNNFGGSDGSSAGDGVTGPEGSGSGSADGDGSGDDDSGGGDDGSSAGDGDDGVKFDTPDGETAGGDEGGGECGCGETDWSYVWVANSSEGTVSKINTRSLAEEGRYMTRATNGSPSRTSVSVDGRAVVVANRAVGLTKIWTRAEDCAGGNTSSGPGDVKAWGQDDCMAWFSDFPGKTVQRPVAWTAGQLNSTTCEYENQQIWTTTGSGGSSANCGPEGVTVHLVNGDDGTIDDEVYIPEAEFNCDHTGSGLPVGLGPYGGAVDPEGNFWFHGWGNNKLVRVELASMNYEIMGGGSYGITVDTHGRVWTNWVQRYDPDTGMWASPPSSVGGSGGIAQDLQGRIWAAAQNGVIWVDMETLAVGDMITLPFSGQAKGVSADIDGYVWVTFQNDTNAYRIDPNTYEVKTVSGLNDPYTYSDMTGGQIANVECNPPEG